MATQKNSKSIPSDSKEEGTLKIDGETFKFWKSMELNFSMDSIDSFNFTFPFDPSLKKYREIFQPLLFKEVEVYIGGDIYLTGKMIITNPTLTAKSNVVSVSGYSSPGILNDCDFPDDKFPIEFNSLNLQQIADFACEIFDLEAEFDFPPGAIFDRVAAKSGENILSFLIKLAKQRNFITGNTLPGKLLFTRTTTKESKESLIQGQPPFLGGSPEYNGQQYFSSITGLSPTLSWGKADSFKKDNPFLKVLRPKVFKITDAKSADVQTTVNSKIGRMFANIINPAIRVQGWRNKAGDIWQPNTKLKLKAPGLMIYNETDFLIRKVSLTREKSDQSILSLVLPESLEGKIPGTLPWL